MTRYAASIGYQGSEYLGWQRLKHYFNTIQSIVEEAVSLVANESVQVKAAGRTDAGVHAMNQIIHFDSNSLRSVDNWLNGVNRYLPNDIAMNWVQPVAKNFHARFSAISRQYVYMIYNHSSPSAHWNQRILWVQRKLSVDNMQKAANFLIGLHDFNAFRSVKCQANNAVRCIYTLRIQQIQSLILIKIEANAFLHHMVRNIVGSLLVVGEGRQSIEWMKTVLQSKNRRNAGATAAAHGLYLSTIHYSELFNLPKQAMYDENSILQYMF